MGQTTGNGVRLAERRRENIGAWGIPSNVLQNLDSLIQNADNALSTAKKRDYPCPRGNRTM
jgi:hypothetical protein